MGNNNNFIVEKSGRYSFNQVQCLNRRYRKILFLLMLYTDRETVTFVVLLKIHVNLITGMYQEYANFRDILQNSLFFKMIHAVKRRQRKCQRIKKNEKHDN